MNHPDNSFIISLYSNYPTISWWKFPITAGSGQIILDRCERRGQSPPFHHLFYVCHCFEKKLEIAIIALKKLLKRSPLESFLFELFGREFAFASYGVRPDAVGECQAMMVG